MKVEVLLSEDKLYSDYCEILGRKYSMFHCFWCYEKVAYLHKIDVTTPEVHTMFSDWDSITPFLWLKQFRSQFGLGLFGRWNSIYKVENNTWRNLKDNLFVRHWIFDIGWEVPVWFAKGYDVPGFKPSFRRANWFEPVHKECEFIVNDVGIIDLSATGKFEVTGPDARIFLDELVAGDLPEVMHYQYY